MIVEILLAALVVIATVGLVLAASGAFEDTPEAPAVPTPGQVEATRRLAVAVVRRQREQAAADLERRISDLEADAAADMGVRRG